MSFVKVSVISLAGAILVVGGALYYFQSKLSKITVLPSSHLRAEPFAPRKMEGETRDINLGFSRFALPAVMPGNPVQMHGTLFVSFTPEDSRPIVTICPPLSDRDEALRDFLGQLRVVTGEASASWFEAQSRILGVQPFTVFDAIAKGRRASIRDATLLGLKGLIFAAARDVVRVFENESTGAFIYHGETCAFIDVYDKAAGISQLVLVNSEAGNLDHIASALVQSYRANSESTTEAALLDKLRATGIQNLPEPPHTAESKLQSEEERPKVAAEEVRKQRAERSK